jgi:rhamnosyltransferase
MTNPSAAVLEQQKTAAAQTHDASILLLTYNGSAYLKQILEMLQRQKHRPAEILAIDSGSTDGTAEILMEAGIRLRRIPKAEFSHSRTRNLGAQMASGKYIVFLTQDATPADSCWLEQLLLPFQKYDRIAGSYSRQIARPDANLLEANDLRLSFRSERQVRSLPETGFHRKNVWKLIHFSNSSAAYNRQLLLENPFREDLPMAEDQEWAMRMLAKGFQIAYEPESMVLHSHNHTLREKYDRDYRMGAAFSIFLSPLLGSRNFPLSAGLFHVISDALFILKRFPSGLKWLFSSPIHRAAIHYAYYRGWNQGMRGRVRDEG